ncbi:hypothetical protein R3P38DRAFT_2584750, partial [Favolaschia claudopus]
ITPETDDYFKLTGSSSTKKDNRERVEKGLQDYHFIFPVVWKKAAAAADGAADDAANPKLEIKFQANLPFHSGPIIDTINEKFFSKPRCLGRKYKKLFKGPDSHPNEFELPDTMVALVAVYVSLSPTTRGRYVDAGGYTQARLETTYRGLLKFITDMRNDDEEQAHRVLHKLYFAVG